MTRRYSKYHNTRTEYNGRVFASKHEAHWAGQLDLMRFAKNPKDKVTGVEYQFRMPLMVNGQKIADYFADFRVTFADGRVEIWDAKGMRTDVYKLKKKLVKAIHGCEIVEV